MAKSDDVSAVEKKTGPLLNVARQPIQKSFAPIPLSPSSVESQDEPFRRNNAELESICMSHRLFTLLLILFR